MKDNKSFLPYVATLSVCKESRDEALIFYVRLPEHYLLRCYPYFDQTNDTILLPDTRHFGHYINEHYTWRGNPLPFRSRCVGWCGCGTDRLGWGDSVLDLFQDPFWSQVQTLAASEEDLYYFACGTDFELFLRFKTLKEIQVLVEQDRVDMGCSLCFKKTRGLKEVVIVPGKHWYANQFLNTERVIVEHFDRMEEKSEGWKRPEISMKEARRRFVGGTFCSGRAS
jgi:hypothetical protein